MIQGNYTNYASRRRYLWALIAFVTTLLFMGSSTTLATYLDGPINQLFVAFDKPTYQRAASFVVFDKPAYQRAGEEAIVFAVIGDYGDDNPDEQEVADLIESWSPAFIVTTGDNSYGSTEIDQNIGQYYSDYIGNYVGDFGAGSPQNRFFPAPGNHDHTDGGGIDTYLEYFTLPGDGIESSSGSERYYDYVQGPVHLFVIDSKSLFGDSNGSDSPQALWLQAQLAASTAPWQVVYFHHPPYSSGNHGNESSMAWPFADWGADIVLTGHDHNYERIVRDGIVYFVNGAGGKPLRNCNTPVEGSQICYNTDHGAMRIEATEHYIKSEFLNVEQQLIDSYTILANRSTCTNESEPLLPFGTAWKYLDDGSDQGTAWRTVGFDDSAWASGAAQLGFGDGDEATSLNAGDITYYFRHTFTIAETDAINALALELVRDDGAVVYLNGTEVFRSNMPSGSMTYQTRARYTMGGASEDNIYTTPILPSLLQSGSNLLAVEVHQRSSSSSDISFDLALNAINNNLCPGIRVDKQANTISASVGQSISYSYQVTNIGTAALTQPE